MRDKKIRGNQNIHQSSHQEIELDPRLEEELHREVLEEAPTSNFSYLIAVTTELSPSTVKLYDLSTGKEFGDVATGHTGPINCLENLDQTKILTGGADCKAKVFG